MMYEPLRSYTLALPGAREDYPFGPETLVCKVGGKVFALLSAGEPAQVSLKCDPPYAEDLRALYPAIRPGYHLNKRHWNTVSLDGTIPDDLLYALVDDSYHLVVRGLPRTVRGLIPLPNGAKSE